MGHGDAAAAPRLHVQIRHPLALCSSRGRGILRAGTGSLFRYFGFPALVGEIIIGQHPTRGRAHARGKHAPCSPPPRACGAGITIGPNLTNFTPNPEAPMLIGEIGARRADSPYQLGTRRPSPA